MSTQSEKEISDQLARMLKGLEELPKQEANKFEVDFAQFSFFQRAMIAWKVLTKEQIAFWPNDRPLIVHGDLK